MPSAAARRGPSSSSQSRGAATHGISRPRSEYGAIVVFAGWFWLQSTSTLPGRRLLVIRETTSRGMSRSRASASRRAYSRAASVSCRPEMAA
jgi:hypothetical protein